MGMSTKRKLTAVENLLARYYQAVLKKEYWDNELSRIKDEMSNLVINGNIKINK